MFKTVLVATSILCTFPSLTENGYIEFEKKDDSVTYIHPKAAYPFPDFNRVGIVEYKIFNKRQSSRAGNFQSILSTKLCDCKNRAIQTVRISVYDYIYPTGPLVFERDFKDHELKWEPLVKGSHGEALCKIACSILTHHQ